MDPSKSTAHKDTQGLAPRSQATSGGSTSGLDNSSLQDAKFVVVPNLQVVDPDTFLKENFGEGGCGGEPTITSNEMKLSYCVNPEKRPESGMYSELTEAFNNILENISIHNEPGDYVPKGPMKCLNTSSIRFATGQQSGHNATLGPDLFLTFDPDGISQATEKKETRRSAKSKKKDDDDYQPPGEAPTPVEGKSPEELLENDINTSIWYRAGITIEVKGKRTHDIGIHSSSKGDRPDFASMSKNAQDLVRQSLGYTVHGQWPILPYRFIWSMTITGDVLRIWRWSSTGAMVTDMIEYEKNPRPVILFLQAVAGGPYSRLGIDIGLNRTFRRVVDAQASKQKLADLYIERAYPSQMESLRRWYVKAKLGSLLQFDIPEDSDPVGEATPTIKSYVVISTPINDVVGIFSRSTRVYLAISKTDFDRGNFNASDLRTLKLSWQYVLRNQEIDFHREVRERKPGVTIKYLAEAIDGGSFGGTLQKYGRFLRCRTDDLDSSMWASFTSPLPTEPVVEMDSTVIRELPQIYCQGMRELRWILFKDVGRPLQAFEAIQDRIQALLHALEANHELVERDILHRDISENNVMMDLVKNSGLLIDLDMAKDLRQDASKFNASIAHVFPVREGANRPTETVSRASGHSTSDISPTQDTLEQDTSLEPSRNPDVRDPITGTLLYLSVAIERDPDRQEWHDLESFFWLLVWIIIRHFPRGFLTHGTVYDLSDPVQRENALNSVFPLDNLNSKRKGIHILSLSKKAFLTSGKLSLPGADEIETLIAQLRKTLAKLYSALDLADALDDDCTRITNKRNSMVPGSATLTTSASLTESAALPESAALTVSAAFTASTTRHSLFRSTQIHSHLAQMVQDARSLQKTCEESGDEESKRDAEIIEDSIESLEAAMTRIQGGFPDYDLFHREFTRAVAVGRAKGRVIGAYDFQGNFAIVNMAFRTVIKRRVAKPSNPSRHDLFERLRESGRPRPPSVLGKRLSHSDDEDGKKKRLRVESGDED